MFDGEEDCLYRDRATEAKSVGECYTIAVYHVEIQFCTSIQTLSELLMEPQHLVYIHSSGRLILRVS